MTLRMAKGRRVPVLFTSLGRIYVAQFHGTMRITVRAIDDSVDLEFDLGLHRVDVETLLEEFTREQQRMVLSMLLRARRVGYDSWNRPDHPCAPQL